jgi:DNA-directed RNA polymerase sigma subunit (sigma70/sigma32)
MRSNQTIKYFSRFILRFPQLSGREKEILLKRLTIKSLEQIGESYNVTEARVRQIEKKALEKIKNKAQQLSLFR